MKTKNEKLERLTKWRKSVAQKDLVWLHIWPLGPLLVTKDQYSILTKPEGVLPTGSQLFTKDGYEIRTKTEGVPPAGEYKGFWARVFGL